MTTTALTEAAVLEILRHVKDPEVDCNIVDLGLIYGVRIEDAKVTVTMTLTTQGCPMHDSIAWGVKAALLNLPEVEEVSVDIVWDPPWNPSRMTDYGRQCTGIA